MVCDLVCSFRRLPVYLSLNDFRMAHTALGENWEAADCYREAVDRDVGNLEIVNKLKEVSELLQEEAAYVSKDRVIFTIRG